MNEEKKNSILVVDDVHANRLALVEILSPMYTVYVEKNGPDAIETAEELLPDVILLDIIMPEMDGYEVITLLKSSEKTNDIPVIFITGLRDTEDEKKGLALGAADYITKPFRPEIVELRVRNHVNIVNHIRMNMEKERAERNIRARVDFLIRMSHEMLTPLNVIMGMVHILNTSDGSDKIKKCADEIDNASRYLLGLVHDLLDVSGKNKGAFTLNDNNFIFHLMFMEIMKEIERDIAKKQQQFTSDIDPALQQPLLGDDERLAQVITNLLTNAVKFTPDHGEIHFSARLLEVAEAEEKQEQEKIKEDEDGEEGTDQKKKNEEMTLQVEITDNGIGISEEQQKGVFSLFEQVDTSLTRAQGGVGLGLPISKRIVEMMGGKIWVESELGKGSKFCFTCKVRKSD